MLMVLYLKDEEEIFSKGMLDSRCQTQQSHNLSRISRCKNIASICLGSFGFFGIIDSVSFLHGAHTYLLGLCAFSSQLMHYQNLNLNRIS